MKSIKELYKQSFKDQEYLFLKIKKLQKAHDELQEQLDAGEYPLSDPWMALILQRLTLIYFKLDYVEQTFLEHHHMMQLVLAGLGITQEVKHHVFSESDEEQVDASE